MINKIIPYFGRRRVGGVVPSTLLLDDYPDAATAYSLRYLRAGYIGSPVIRVRRSSDNLEDDFTPDEIINGVLESWVGVGNDGFVTIWYDQSLFTINAIQATLSAQPKIVSIGSIILENSMPSLLFSGSQYLQASISLQSQPNTYFVVNYKRDNYLFDSTQGTNRNANGDSDWIFAGSVLYNAYPVAFWSNQRLFTALFNSTSSTTWIDGAFQVTGNSGTMAMSGLRIGAGSSLGFPRLNGNVQEFVFYNQDQTTNRIGIESNINAYYSIY